MDNDATQIEVLFGIIEDYSRTTLKLYRLKAIETSATIVSSVISKCIVFLIIASFSLFFTIGVALYVGALLGEIFYGFLLVAFFYLLIGLIVYIKREKWIIIPLSNFTIKHLLNQGDHEK